MPRQYRRYKKRFFKRYGSKSGFSKFSTYKNRSSKSQANQIYKLNKRLTKVENRNKPEYLEWGGPLRDSDTLQDGTWSYHYANLMLGADGSTVLKDQIGGDKIKLVNVSVYGFIKRKTLLYTTKDLPNDQATTFQQPSFYGIFILGLMPKATSDAPAINQFVRFSEVQDQPDLIFKAPLVKGCGSVMKILKVKKFKITNSDIQSVPFKISTNLKYKTATKVGSDVLMSYNPVLLYAICQNANISALTIAPANESIFDVQFRSNLIYTDN